MNVLARFVQLFNAEAAAIEGTGAVTLPPATVEGVGTVAAPDDPERAAKQEVQRAESVLAALQARRDSTIKTIESLVSERSRIGRELAIGQSSDADFVTVESQLGASLARRDGLDALLAEATAARAAAYEQLRAASAPRLAAERRARVEAATAKAQATRDRFVASFTEASRLLGELANELDELAQLAPDAAFNTGYLLGPVTGNPLSALVWNPQSVRQPSRFVPVEFRLRALASPVGRV